MSITREVRYERLRPAQIVEARNACPVAYLPIGTLEWHGFHNPVGLDCLKCHPLMIRCAEAIGGLVFPPLYYGENRSQMLKEADAPDRKEIVEGMGLSPSNFSEGYMVDSVQEQNRRYHQLLIHIFQEIKSLGFKVLVVSAGHYPLLDHARAAAAVFHQEQTQPRMIVWSMSGYELVRGRFTPCGDHAGKWETSLLMHLDPGMIDLSLLDDADGHAPVGVTNNSIAESSEEFGKAAADAIIEVVQARVSEFLAKPNAFEGHGSPM